MTTTNKTQIAKDVANKKLTVTREFNAPLQDVWNAWTQSKLLDQWWAPKPWKAETKTMDFKVGGYWLYAMAGPDGSKHWSRVDFKSIDMNRSFSYVASFCDEQGNKNADTPLMYWKNDFSATSSGSKVIVELTFDKPEDFKTMMDMGFEGGFTMGLNNLDELLAK